MQQHKITCRQDLADLHDSLYDEEEIFEILETGEMVTIGDFLYFVDWSDFETATIQHRIRSKQYD